MNDWATYISHPSTGLALQYTDTEHEARILENGEVRYDPSRDTELVRAEYWRLVTNSL